MSIWSKQYDALNALQRKAFENAIADNEFTGERFIRLGDFAIQRLLIHYFDGIKLLNLLEYLKEYSSMLFDHTRFFVLDNFPVLAANIELLEKHKQGEREIASLLEMLFTPSLAMAG